MAMFPESFIRQVQEATDIVDVVGQFVALRKRGKEFLGVCPFHDDHRPSMYVSPAKQIFKCFACGAGGGVFQFLTLYQKMTFPDVVRQLADRAGIPVPRDESPAQADRSLSSDALASLMVFAARYYRDQLHSPPGAAALAYARGRKLTEDSIRRFGVGFAPDSWDALCSAAAREGFTDRQLLAAGLTAQREDGSGYDRFRNRLIFPILDPTGRVIAFGGRALSPEERAKYLNSPETVLFDKSANLYALNWSRQAIVDSGQAVVVEGYLDALMCIQEGVENVVATLGTALTERHVRTLGRLAGEAVLVFDADTAGQAAADRAVELFLMQRLNVRVAAVPKQSGPLGEVKDPCDYVLSAGPDAMRKLLADAPDALEHAWRRRRVQYQQAATLAQRREIVDDFLRMILTSVTYGAIDPVRQGLLAGQVAELVGISQADVTSQMRRLARQIRTRPSGKAPSAEPSPANDRADRAEEWLLGALINAPELLPSLGEDVRPTTFADPMLRLVAERLWSLIAESRFELAALLLAEESPQWGRTITDLHLAGQQRGCYEQVLADAAANLKRRQERSEVQVLKQKADTSAEEVMRKVQQEGRKADQRRRPRL